MSSEAECTCGPDALTGDHDLGAGDIDPGCVVHEFAHEIRFSKGYDHRDDPSGSRGAHNAELRFILRGPLGVIEATVSTGWMARPLVGWFVPGQAQRRRDKPGVDGRLNDHYPHGSRIILHSPQRLKDWWMGPDGPCELVGEKCWGDCGYTVADEFFERLMTGGEDVGWNYLRELYDEWFSPEPVAAGSSTHPGEPE